MTMLWIAAIAFVGTHFLMSHPLRRPMVGALGERGFLGVYSLISIATFVWMVIAYRAVPYGLAAWDAGDGVWIAATILMWIASVLLAGSLIGNPALPASGANRLAAKQPRGVFRITRHPMMWSFALWGLVHILIAPRAENFILCGAIILLALAGAALQDGKKKRLMGADWKAWVSKTSFVPFARGFAMPGGVALIGGTLLWLVAMYGHRWFGIAGAGIFRWV
ncbi:NnrU family protein [Novosphingopyxis sp.]|uniref:NnrU family protein n=1 Tax=Novosphingopyxis sp. TaxID=2709690 RepID=UPI003B5A4241